jgi:ABC-type phosphate transport system permease subunit
MGMKKRWQRRHIIETIMKGLMLVSFVIVAGSLALILWIVVSRGLPALTWDMISQTPKAAQAIGARFSGWIQRMGPGYG